MALVVGKSANGSLMLAIHPVGKTSLETQLAWPFLMPFPETNKTCPREQRVSWIISFVTRESVFLEEPQAAVIRRK